MTSATRRWTSPPLIANARLRWALWLGLAVYLALAIGTLDINWARVYEGIPRGQTFVMSFFPPDFVSRFDSIVEGVTERLWMTVVSTGIVNGGEGKPVRLAVASPNESN